MTQNVHPEADATGVRPGAIKAVPVRHPGRWVATGFIAVLVLMLAHLLVTNKVLNWSFVIEVMQQKPVVEGLLKGTILVTVLSMIIGVSGGVLMAVMRLSPNRVLSWSAWVFIWFFRGIPRLVLLTTMGALGALFTQGIGIGVPFDWKIMEWLGLDASMRFLTLDANAIFSGILAGVLGLGLSEAAYMAEIARAGILSVDPGQREAAQALGMSSGKTMLRIVLPQAMRVIVPPTGNETIAMLKDTSLLVGIPVITELFYQTHSIGARTFQSIPGSIAATLYYLALGSLLMAGQYFLERHFGRGFGAKTGNTKAKNRLMGMTKGSA